MVKKYLRLLSIYKVISRYRLYGLINDLGPARFSSLPLTLLLNLPFRAHPRISELSRGRRLRLALEELGPIFIKFGQLLSTRRDMLPNDIADELAYLQDQVPPFAGDQAKDLIEEALEDSIENLFSDFDITPLASASIAQVHTAKLKNDGSEIVIKVIRPGIEDIITQDIALLQTLARLLENNAPQGKRLRPQEIVADYKHVIFDELNLLSEGANATQLRRNFENSSQLYVPKVYWDYSRANILVMERIYGIPVGQIDELKAANIDLKVLAETGVEIFFTQVFNHSFFHADMHPGNVFVSRENPAQPQYIALDCAIIGSLSKSDQQYLARNLLAIFKRDYRKVAELHVECGWVPADTPINAFEATMRSVCEPIFEKPLKDISFGLLLLQLFQTAARFNMEVQPSLVLLQKTLINIEGLGKQLYPDLDLWETAMPFLENWQKQRLSPLANLKVLQDKFPEWIEQLPEIPELIFAALNSTKNSQRHTQALLEQYEKSRQKQVKLNSRRQLRFGLLLIAAGLLLSQTTLSSWLDGLSLPGIALIMAGLSIIFLRK